MNKDSIAINFLKNCNGFNEFGNYIGKTATLKNAKFPYNISDSSFSFYEKEETAKKMNNTDNKEKISQDFFEQTVKIKPYDKKRKLTEYNVRTLNKIFNLDINPLDKMDKKYQRFIDCTWGQGAEWKSIRTIHSSALCGLLHFINVGINGKKFTLNNKNRSIFNVDDEKLVFNDVIFEFKNKCIEGQNHPSCVDVALINDKYVLFLELKFSEYIKFNKESFSKSYIDKYNEFFKDANNEFTNNNQRLKIADDIYLIRNENSNDDDKYLTLVDSMGKRSFYIGGVKQIVSHFIGIKNFLKGNFYIDKKQNDKYVINGRTALYAEMCFDFDDESLGSFKTAYNKVKSRLKEYQEREKLDQQIIFAKQILVYKDVFSDSNNKDLLSEKVVAYYGYR